MHTWQRYELCNRLRPTASEANCTFSWIRRILHDLGQKNARMIHQDIFFDHTFTRQTFEGNVEAPEPVSRQRVCPTLEDDRRGLVTFHHFRHNWNKNVLEAFVIDTVSQGKIDSIVFSFASSDVLKLEKNLKLGSCRFWSRQSFRHKSECRPILIRACCKNQFKPGQTKANVLAFTLEADIRDWHDLLLVESTLH